MKKIKKIKSNSGETLVEVMVSMLLFLMILGMLQKSIDFASNAQVRSEELRQNNSAIAFSLRDESTWSDISIEADSEYYEFYSAKADGTIVTGSELLFKVPVKHGKKNVSYTAADVSQKKIEFMFFSSPWESSK